VLHATADLRRTFDNVGRLLAPNGLLVMVEMVRPQRFISITFGLTEGWWKFTDRDLRPSSLLLGHDGWRQFLSGAGFDDPATVPAANDDTPSARAIQAVVVAQATSKPAGSAVGAGQRRWLVLADAGGVGEAVAQELRDRQGDAIIAVSGETYRTTGPGS
jgi:hypothetical protein